MKKRRKKKEESSVGDTCTNANAQEQNFITYCILDEKNRPEGKVDIQK